MSWLQWLFPPICQECGFIGRWLCKQCLAEVEFYPNPVPLNLAEPSLEQIIAATYFQPPMKKLIRALKYHGVKDLGPWLGEWLYDIAPIPADIDYLTAIPLHASKQAARGYNQAELIAQNLAEKMGKPYLPLLIKTQATQAQATIREKAQRLHQQDNVFALNPLFNKPLYLDKLKNCHLLLIDDVVTTGATLNAAAQVLTAAGVSHVTGLAVAHGQ